jgi:hypothetical protein
MGILLPMHEDLNVVPYHAYLLLVWNAHLDIQFIIFSYWSYYLYKYTMKCESHGTPNLNQKNVEDWAYEMFLMYNFNLYPFLLSINLFFFKK